MTHHTDAARAEFEAWARGYGTWEVRRDDDVALGTTGYTDITLTVAWHAVQAARRAPAAPASEPALEAALDAMDKEVTRMQPDRSVHWIGFTRDDRLRVVAAALAAAPQPPEAAPVQLPEPAIPGSQGVCCGNFTTGGYYMGQHEQVCCGCPDDAHPPYYTEQQVRELLANHGIQEQST